METKSKIRLQTDFGFPVFSETDFKRTLVFPEFSKRSPRKKRLGDAWFHGHRAHRAPSAGLPLREGGAASSRTPVSLESPWGRQVRGYPGRQVTATRVSLRATGGHQFKDSRVCLGRHQGAANSVECRVLCKFLLFFRIKNSGTLGCLL